jgi:HAD superfamily hydrolase (TIGR01459 family)
MAPPDILSNVGNLLSGYDVLLCDVWGVVHDGVRAFPAANTSLTRFRESGGTVVLVSNAPMPSDAVARVLDEKAVVRTAWDRIVCSGDLALDEIAARGYRRVLGVGPERRDRDFFARLSERAADVTDADSIACTGLVDDRRETVADYADLLRAARARNLPLVCANPDLVVHVGDMLLPCAGVLAAEYERLGGSVFWAGKPRPIAYETALRVAETLRGARVERSRVLAIGDAARTDLAAAKGAGVDALFIANGIHRDDVLADGRIDPLRLMDLLERDGVRARAAALGLEW